MKTVNVKKSMSKHISKTITSQNLEKLTEMFTKQQKARRKTNTEHVVKQRILENLRMTYTERRLLPLKIVSKCETVMMYI